MARAEIDLDALGQQLYAQGVEIIDTAIGAAVEAERARIRAGARSLTFSLFRPSGRDQGTSLGVVPLADLEKLIGGES
jgi:hypothetical protein